MEPTLLLVVVGLFIAVLIVKTVASVAVRYALFLAVAALIFQDRYGPDIAWLDVQSATQMGVVAAIALGATKVVSLLLFRKSRWSFVLTPLAGVLLTLLAAKIVLP